MLPAPLCSSKRCPLFFRHKQRAQPFEAVGGHATPCGKLGQRLLNSRRQQAGLPYNLPEKQRTASRQGLERSPCVGRKFRESRCDREREPMRQILARKEGDRT